MVRIPRPAMVGLFAATVLTWVVVPSFPAAADCPAPEIFERPAEVGPGDTMTIDGRYWRECDDTGPSCKFGANSPFHGIALTLRPPGGRAGDIALGMVDADGEGRFHVTAELPTDAKSGTWRAIARFDQDQHFGFTTEFVVGDG